MEQTKKLPIKPPHIALTLLFLSWLASYKFPQLNVIDKPYNKIGIIILVIGLSLTFYSFYLFKKNKTPILPGKKPTFVVIEGPYNFTRNPMYLGVSTALLGAAVYFGNLLSFLSPIIFFLVMNYYFVPFEEKLMENLFGKKYLSYKKQVRRWL
ncbi:isoprenylcysteine carboxylmethyltransferase family protein [Candidatus Woesearchaeota archaeon]|nr:isoprenylcysteine carboxylmethyltransferase family protein [Candidatus Woesearchaeota archaeon]